MQSTFLIMESHLNPVATKQEFCEVLIKEEVSFEMVEEQSCSGMIKEESGIVNDIKEEQECFDMIKEEQECFDLSRVQSFTSVILKEEHVVEKQIKKKYFNNIDLNNEKDLVQEEEEIDYVWPEDGVEEIDPLALPEIKYKGEFQNSEEEETVASGNLSESSSRKVLLKMSQKRKGHSSASIKKRVRNSLSLEIKLEVLKLFDKGERVVDIQRVLGLPESSIRTIRSNADKIRKSVESCTNLSVARVATSRSDSMEKMEKLLSTWIVHQNQKNVPISMAIIQVKAKSLYAELSQGNESTPTFNASRGWFNLFKARNAFHSFKVMGEVASADNEGADESREITFKNIIAEGCYIAKQVFNLDETGLYWKKMPSRTFISIEEKTAPGFKAAKECCTLLFGSNASGDYKLKPLMIYQSETPRALKGCDKRKLPVVWKSSKKGWMTGKIFYDYFSQELEQELKLYCENEKIDFNILILVDNVSSHPSEICQINKNIKVVFLPPNTTALLQPMDQGVISAFKANYLKETLSHLINSCDVNNQLSIKDFWKQFNIKMAIDIIDKCWKGLTYHCMNGVWKKLWPEVTMESINNIEEIDSVSQTIKEIVNLTHQAGFTDVDEEDIFALLQPQEEGDLSNEDLLCMEDENCVEMSDEDEKPECVKVLTSKGMSEAFQMINNALSYFENNDPDETRSGKVKREVEHVIKCYRELYNSKL